jgi:putative acetyltransferase
MIRKALAADLDFIYGLYMHPKVNPFLLYEEMPREQFKPIYEDLLAKGAKYIFMDEDQAVGMFKLIPLTHRCDHIVYLGGFAIDPSVSGKGYGHKMLEAILSHSNQHGFKRVELSVTLTNERAIRLYEKLGFRQEGIMRKYSRITPEDQYLDEALMAYLF